MHILVRWHKCVALCILLDEIKVLPSVNEETPFKPFLNGSEMSKSSGEIFLFVKMLMCSETQVKIYFVFFQLSDLTTPLLGTEDEIEEGIEIRVTTDTTGLPDDTSREVKLWEILKPIVYGGLDISVASLGVTSAAAGANAITSMYLESLLSCFMLCFKDPLTLKYSYELLHTD